MAFPLLVSVEVVAELRADYDVVALPLEGLGQDLLAVAEPICVGGVEQVDAVVERLDQQVDGQGLLDLPPPAGADGPDSESHLGDGQVGSSEIPVLHVGVLLR